MRVTEADGRPIRFFVTAGQVSDNTAAAGGLGSLPQAEGLLADRSYGADWFRDPLKDKGIMSCILGRQPRGSRSGLTSTAANTALLRWTSDQEGIIAATGL